MSSEHVLDKISDQINRIIPANAGVTAIEFEGPEVAIYSKNISVLIDSEGLLSQIARTIRKRVVIRSDPSVRLPIDKVLEKLQIILHDKVTIGEIEFDKNMGEVIIYVDKPNKLTKKQDDMINTITKETLWRPKFFRIPPIKSNIIKSIRNVLFTDSAARKEALLRIGKMVHRETLLDEPIIRITSLGGYLEVGRTATLVQTGDANILVDCGVSVGSSTASKMLPRFDLPEFELLNLDAVVISHSHLDHCLPGDTPILMAKGHWKYIRDINKNDEVQTINWNTGKQEIGIVERKTITRGHEVIRNIQTTYGNINASPNHRFFIVRDLNIIEIEASELKYNMLLPFVKAFPNNLKISNILLKTEISFGGRIRINENVRQEIKKLRVDAKLSQQKLADKVSLHTNTISKIETNLKNAYLNSLQLILSQFGIKYKDFATKHNLLRLPDKLTPRLAQLVGYIQGDGHKSGIYSIRITEQDTSVIDCYVEILSEEFGYKPLIRERKDTQSRTYYIEINNKWILDYLEYNFETVLGFSREIHIPKVIENSDDKIVTGYLKGLYDAEGSAIPAIKFTSYSESLVQHVQNLLLRLGIHAAYSEKDHSIYINSIHDKRIYQNIIGFTSKIKTQKMNRNIKESQANYYHGRDLIPITSQDFREILHKIGYIGAVSGAPKINDLPMPLLDFYRRRTGYLTRKTAGVLLEFLQDRYSELEKINKESDLIDIRTSLSVTRNRLRDEIGLTSMEIQYREEGYKDEKTIFLKNFLLSMISDTQINIEIIIKQIELLLSIDVSWQRIKQIKNLPNNVTLFDISVTPNSNFVANSMVVHNCGFLPFLYKYGYEGPVFVTDPTLNLMTMLQIDYLDIAEKEGKLIPYSKSDIRKSTLHAITIKYGEVTDIAPGVKLTFHNAGHILGSAIVHLHIGNGKHNLAFAHDFKFANSRLLDRAVHKFPRLETIVMEATYGNPQDMTPKRQHSEDQLAMLIKKTLARNGKILIPVLAVGRAQELQLVIEHLIRTKQIPEVPVYVDGMVKEATAVTTNHPEFLSRQLRELIFEKNHNPFLASFWHEISVKEEREQLLEGEPCIIMATSGMLVGGPSVYYFNELAEDEKNMIVFVSYQGKGTLGRKVEEGAESIIVKNEQNKSVELAVNMEVHRISGFTGHSDRGELMEYAKRLSPRPKKFLIMHGEMSKCETLAKSIGKSVKREAIAPPIGTTTRLY